MEANEKIGIGITTKNRRSVFFRSYTNWKKYLPNNARLIVVDDASDVPCSIAYHRFNDNVGIARSKNKCLEILKECDHIFLVDDDVFPIHENWYKPYINSKYNHLQLSFEKNSKGERLSHDVFLKEKKKDVWIFNRSNGCMLYFKKECIDKVGGMDPNFGKWGNEHLDLSFRIYNNGLTPYPFIDVPDSLKYFHVSDYYGEVISSVPEDVRVEHIKRNQILIQNSIKSKKFICLK